jgi:superfamily II DNA or RNA helicase
MGKGEIPVGETINASRDRYNIKDPFVVVEVITINENQLQNFGVETIQQLEEKIRKKLNFISDDNFDGDEFWKGIGISELIDNVHNYIFEGKHKETFEPRIPQKKAIEKMINAFTKGIYKEFLFGAIMRFGKNFAFLCAIVEIFKNNPTARILVWTNKPGVFNTLEKDINGHIKFIDYKYVSIKESKDIKVLPNKCVVAASRQLLENCKNEEVMSFIEKQEWDFIVIDESHTGIETESAQKFLDKFKNTRKIYISGTPQKQLGKIQFNNENTFIYDEVCQKKDKESGIWLDAIVLKTHLIKLSSESVEQYKNCINDDTGYFTFTKFFSHKKGGGLTYEQSVLKFFMDFFGYNKLDDSYNFFGKHKNVAILVPSNVEGTKEIKKILENSIFGQDYEIVAATGKEFRRNQLENAFLSGKKTITLLSDMLIEGETVPEWDCAINMSDGTSIFKYLQFAFRPTNPNKNNPNKEAFFYDMNPQRHFFIQSERMRLKGLKGINREQSLRDWYKNFKIMISENVEGMCEVNFDVLKKESYRLGNMMKSINSLMYWGNIDLTEIKNDLNGIEKQNSENTFTTLNDNGLGGGKNSKRTQDKKNQENLTEKELKDIQDKWATIVSRVPYVLHKEKCETLSSLLDNFRDMNEMFKGAFGISQKVFEKYWNNSNFIDKSEMDFYFKNFAELI